MDSALDQKRVPLKLIILFAVVIAILIAAAVYFYIQYDNNKITLNSLDTRKYEATIETNEVWNNDVELFGKSITELNEEKISENTYIAPNGLTVQSIGCDWKNEDLKAVYKELLNNKHGRELDYLKKITLKPNGTVYDQEGTAGEYEEKSMYFTVAIAFPALINGQYIMVANPDCGNIYLYHMDEVTEIREIAGTLTHEYGHHYTFQYFFAGDNEVREKSKYYQIRGLSEYPDAKDYKNYDDYYKMHAWDINEIAAEDYSQLLGSPTGKEIGEYMDVKEALFSNDMKWIGGLQRYHYNVFAQENPMIPMAEQVEGLEAYYHSFIDDSYVEKYVEYGNIVIESQKKRSNGRTHYILSWNELTLPTDSDVIYTVVCFDEDGSLFRGIKTVSEDEELTAVIGIPTRRKGSWIYWWDDGTMEENRIFRVFAYIVDEGIMIGSEPYYAEF